MTRTDTHSQHIAQPDVIRYDPATGQTTNRGNAVEAPSRPHEARQSREDEWEDFCYEANVKIHGKDRADALRAMFTEGDV